MVVYKRIGCYMRSSAIKIYSKPSADWFDIMFDPSSLLTEGSLVVRDAKDRKVFSVAAQCAAVIRKSAGPSAAHPFSGQP